MALECFVPGLVSIGLASVADFATADQAEGMVHHPVGCSLAIPLVGRKFLTEARRNERNRLLSRGRQPERSLLYDLKEELWVRSGPPQIRAVPSNKAVDPIPVDGESLSSA